MNAQDRRARVKEHHLKVKGSGKRFVFRLLKSILKFTDPHAKRPSARTAEGLHVSLLFLLIKSERLLSQ